MSLQYKLSYLIISYAYLTSYDEHFISYNHYHFRPTWTIPTFVQFSWVRELQCWRWSLVCIDGSWIWIDQPSHKSRQISFHKTSIPSTSRQRVWVKCVIPRLLNDDVDKAKGSISNIGSRGLEHIIRGKLPVPIFGSAQYVFGPPGHTLTNLHITEYVRNYRALYRPVKYWLECKGDN